MTCREGEIIVIVVCSLENWNAKEKHLQQEKQAKSFCQMMRKEKKGYKIPKICFYDRN